MVDTVSARAPGAPQRPDPGARERYRLVALSFLMLFVELALIRWAGSNVLHLSYFSNFVLLGSFLGIGIGFLRGEVRRDLFPYAPAALAALVAFILFFPVDVRVADRSVLFFTSDQLESSGPPLWLTLPVIFVAVAATLTCLTQGVARSFAKFEPLEAYRLDVLGSLLGIAGFSALSFLGAPPLAWGLIAAAGLLVLVPMRTTLHVARTVAPLVILLGLLAGETFTGGTSWSPYYKVTVEGDDHPVISVNGVPHQVILPTDTDVIYDEVYDLLPAGQPVGEVLIVGAGSGNDVAKALERGASRVDAVEIDPRIHELGVELHPDRPYDDPRVEVHIGDGRAFLHRTDRTYDLILFALPDSITLVSGQSALRLESYLFTVEAVEAVRDRLRPDGTFAMYNYYREPWLVDRLAATVTEAFGQRPCVGVGDRGGVFASIAVAEEAGTLQCDTIWQPVSDAVPEPSTDDHPFPYLRDRGLPSFYVLALAFIVLASLIGVRTAAGPYRRMAPFTDLFCMGAAFLLLETKHVVQFALLFGTTWFVNALVFAGVLVSVLAAIEVARRYTPRRPGVLYVLLGVALAVAWAVPNEALLGLSSVPRFIAAVGLAFTPIFLANLIFAERFRDVASSTAAFGANLLGAMVGGVLEYFALVVGYKSLIFVVAALYGLAFLTGRRHLRELRMRSQVEISSG